MIILNRLVDLTSNKSSDLTNSVFLTIKSIKNLW